MSSRPRKRRHEPARRPGPAVLILALLTACLPAIPLPGFATAFATAQAAEASEPPAAPAPPPAAEPPGPPEPERSPVAPEPPEPPAPPDGKGKASFAGGSYSLGTGETHKGDLYLFGSTVDIAGTQEGDVFVFVQSLSTSGTVEGDVAAWAQTVNLGGKIGDSVRVWGATVTITGEVDGSVLAMAGTVTLTQGSHVTGDVKAGGGQVSIQGIVDGDVDVTAGEVVLGGTLNDDVEVKCDVLKIQPGTKIAKDLVYKAREEVDLEGKDVVGGKVEYEEKTEEQEEPVVRKSSVFWWFFKFLASLVVGVFWLAVFPRSARAAMDVIHRDALRGTAIGFVAAIVIPVAAALSCILIITIPLAIIVFLAWAFALFYLAKLPVAFWLGERITNRFGGAGTSPYPGLLAGLFALYLLFAIPVLGKIAWFICAFIGFGAFVTGGWNLAQARKARNEAAGEAPPPPSSPDAGPHEPAVGGAGTAPIDPR